MPFDGGNVLPTVADKMMDVLGPNGEHWIKDVLTDGKGGHCLLGAHIKATGAREADYFDEQRYARLAKAVIAAGGKPSPSCACDACQSMGMPTSDGATVARWNNASSTGWPEIKLALEFLRQDELAERARVLEPA